MAQAPARCYIKKNGGLVMKMFVVAVIIAVMLLDALMCYCLMRSGAEEDRWMEQHPLSADRDSEKREENFDDV